MELQGLADNLLDGLQGSLILLNAETGEILVMASHPGFDPNQLDQTWDQLLWIQTRQPRIRQYAEPP